MLQHPDSILLIPGGGSVPGSDQPDVKEEAAIMFGEPTGRYPLPSGRQLLIYPQSEGQLRLVEEAYQKWTDSIRYADGKLRRAWRFWAKRRASVDKILTRQQSANCDLFIRILEDRYDPEKHQDLSVDEFLSMGLDLQEAILRQHHTTNDVSRLLRAASGLPPDKEKKSLSLETSLPSPQMQSGSPG